MTWHGVMVSNRVLDPMNPKNITFRGVEVHLPFLCPGNNAVLITLKMKSISRFMDKAIPEGVSLAKSFRLDEMLLPKSLI